MRIELDDQGIAIGVHPVPIEEISSSIAKKLISRRPDLSYIESQGPESVVPVDNGQWIAINTIIEILAETINLSQLEVANFINNWDLTVGTGYLLDSIGATFFGLDRLRAEPSEAVIILIGNRGTMTYTSTTPEPLKVPRGFTISISGRKFLTKYEQEFTNAFDDASTTLTLTGVRYIKLQIDKSDNNKVNCRFDTNNISHSTAETDPMKIAEGLLQQVHKFSPWSNLSNRSIVKDDVIGGVEKVNEDVFLSLGFDEPVSITIPNTSTNKLMVVKYGIEFICRESEDDIEGLIPAGTQVDKISDEENKKITTDNSQVKGKIDEAFLWTDSTRTVQRETDDEYRERLFATRGITAVGSLESMKHLMFKIPGVTHCHIINNPTGNERKIHPPSDTSASTEEDADALTVPRDTTKLPKFSIEPYSFCVFVEGGDPTAITNTIYNLTPVGVPSSGHRYVELKAANGEKVKVRFARPVPKPISILVKFTKSKSGIDVKSYQPPKHVVESTIRGIVMEEIADLAIGSLLKIQIIGKRFIDTMPWMAHYLISIAEKGGITDKSSSEFKHTKQLTTEPYEFFLVKREDIVIEEEQLE